MRKIESLAGQKIGNWLVVGEDLARHKQKGARFWFCRCRCGKMSSILQSSLRGYVLSGRGSASCGNVGCRLNTTHGQSNTSTYRIWCGIWARCTNPSNRAFKNYGGRGIAVCAQWESFEAFLRDMGHRPGKIYSLDRVDNGQGYSPANCRWATKKEQQNNMRSNVLMSFNGKSLSVAEWSKELGIPAGTINSRASRGFPIEDILSNGKWIGSGGNTRCVEKKQYDRARCVQITFEGSKLTMSEWAEKLKINRSSIRSRHYAGMSAKDILSTESLRKGHNQWTRKKRPKKTSGELVILSEKTKKQALL